MLRRWAASGPEQRVPALDDGPVAASVRAMHAEPGRPWTVPELAAVAHLSRAQFAHRFTMQLGQTPAAYLLHWRMTLACRRLEETADPVTVIAADLGYRSTAAFHRGFVRVVGRTPAAHRRAYGPAAPPSGAQRDRGRGGATGAGERWADDDGQPPMS